MKVHKRMAIYIGFLLFSAFSSNIIAECGPCGEEQVHKGMLQSLRVIKINSISFFHRVKIQMLSTR